MRSGSITRKTGETDITLSLTIEGNGVTDITTGVGFLDHMLTLFAKHGKFDLTVRCDGDTNVDDHHSVEDIGICLGDAFAEALGDRRGIIRYADKTIPMDEALVLCAVDISGRGGFYFDLPIDTPKVGTFDTELVEEFFTAFTRRSDITMHIIKLRGSNSHHIIEAAFKAFGRTLAAAAAIDPGAPDEIPSTKGVL